VPDKFQATPATTPGHAHRLHRGEQSVTTDFEITEALTAGCRS
jgi:hypothetical protein